MTDIDLVIFSAVDWTGIDSELAKQGYTGVDFNSLKEGFIKLVKEEGSGDTTTDAQGKINIIT